ncbi:ArnT family glycosyltransferase [Novipirellula sp. SH528]|uniref:ArnT family glycosyltransferase n=1 Tax=Novipirellula sp. SH528 TaxID=3454466 RepID=UPI003F9F69BC
MAQSENEPSAFRFGVFVIGLPLLITWFWLSDLGGYPSNDDPFYGRPAQILAEESRFQVIRQGGDLSASSSAHVVIGAAVSKVIGYSYRALFLAVILQLWIAAVAVYKMAREANCSERFSLFWAAVFLFNPLCFGHGFTFMTDGPAMCWGIYAIYCFSRGLRRSSLGWLAAGSVAIGVAFWMRQTHVLLCGVPVAAIGLLWLRGQLTLSLWKGLVACVLPAALGVLLFESGWIVFGDKARVDTIFPDTFNAKQWMINTYGMAILVGFLLLPALPLWVNRTFFVKREPHSFENQHRVASLLFGGLVAVALLVPFVATQGRACLTSATATFIQNAHLGPIFLSDFEIPERWCDMGGVSWPIEIWKFVTALSIANTGLLATSLYLSIARWFLPTSEPTNDQSSTETFDVSDAIVFGCVATSIAVIVLVLGVATGVLDRYWMLLLPLVLAVGAVAMAREPRQHNRVAGAISGILLICFLTVSVVFVRDYLAWNQTRWQTFEALLDEGYLPEQIDGGRDMNAWYRSAEDVDTMPREGDTTSWWSGRAIIAMSIGPRDGWEEVDKIRWRAWATGREHFILLLRKTSEGKSLSSKESP